ncbi:MAG: chemotaxis protein CheW [Rhodospirillales bacterium]|nr:chemotaxis protein CheW [Rhodospirillales bacterium]
MDDLLTEFLTETSESLAVIDVELVKFEQDPQDEAILGNIFRLVHTIKGTCGFLGLPRLESVAHAGENILGKFRDGALQVTPEAVTLILRCIDTIRDLLGELESTGEEPEGEDREIIDEMNAMAEGRSPGAAAPAPEPAAAAAAPAATGESNPSANEFGAPVAQELLDEVMQAESAGVVAASDHQMKEADEKPAAPKTNDFGAPIAQELLDEVEQAEAAGIQAATPAQIRAEAEAEREDENDMGVPEIAESALVPAPVQKDAAAAKKVEKSPTKESSVAQSSIRVHVDVLEDLMTLVSELVLTRNQLLQMVRGMDDSEFTVPLQRLSHITSDLQEGVMKTRMQPIGNAWAKLPRIVRDLSVDSGKQIDLVMLGAETELDRQVLELIKDPLTHMVRNSADHGLELPQERMDIGKPGKGTITLNAYHEGGHIIIQIADDGKGLNMERIRQKCLDNGLVSDLELAGMSDQQIQQYIFAAGFSTAEKVTSVSGRGVGMDVVRTNIEKIGGTVELKSVEGKGTTFTIKIPLTLAIVSALIVACCEERFAIPQISVLELVRASLKSDNAIEMINDSPVLRLRNRLLPLISLQTLLKLEKKPKPLPVETIEADEAVGDSEEPVGDAPKPVAAETEKAIEENDELFIVVTQVGNNTFGIIVDRVFDTEEIVVKPVAPILRDITFYSGNTILGDGSVIMILDPNGIANAAGQMDSPDMASDKNASTGAGGGQEKTSLLVFRAGANELKAVPLALVARLEEIDMATTETSHGQVMVQYRGRLMPLVPFDDGHQFKTEGRQPILVFTDQERSMGLVVDDIVDIVEERLKIELATDVPGLVGSAVLAGKATDIIDAGYYLTQAFSDWFGTSDSATYKGGEENRRALLVDDSPFFRNLLSPLLSVAGWEVVTAESADAALQLRERGARFDVIISDIEMPGMNGFQFAEAVRADERWKKIPMVALSGNASESDLSKGRQAGFDDYVAKFDREALVSSLAQTVAMAAHSRD